MPTTHDTSHLTAEATVTSRGQATIPASIRKALEIDKAGKIVFHLRKDGTVTITKAPVEPEADPAIDSFLALLENDIKRDPARVRPVTVSQYDSAFSLVEGVDVDLDAPLNPDDE